MHVQATGAAKMANLQFHQAVYYSAVTITTIGYGGLVGCGALAGLDTSLQPRTQDSVQNAYAIYNDSVGK